MSTENLRSAFGQVLSVHSFSSPVSLSKYVVDPKVLNLYGSTISPDLSLGCHITVPFLSFQLTPSGSRKIPFQHPYCDWCVVDVVRSREFEILVG